MKPIRIQPTVGKYTSPMDPMGMNVPFFARGDLKHQLGGSEK